MFDSNIINILWFDLCWPIIRITGSVIAGLLVANLIESLSWSKKISQISRPMTTLAHLSPTATTGFALAFVSGIAANSLLADAFSTKKISKTELMLANLFNSLPRFFLHLPTVFFLTLPFIKGAAFMYVGLTLLAALLQTAIVIVLGRLFLTKPERQDIEYSQPVTEKKDTADWIQITQKFAVRLKKRVSRLLLFMVPIYIVFFLLGKYGVFTHLEKLIVEKAWFLSWLQPQSLSIILLHVTAEFSAGLAAASVMIADSSLSTQQVVLALMIGNLLSTPIRAIRHQFPYYSGIYPFRTAVELIVASQCLRAACIVVVTIGFYIVAFL